MGGFRAVRLIVEVRKMALREATPEEIEFVGFARDVVQVSDLNDPNWIEKLY